MTAEQRRSRISARLHEAHQPISATALAKELGVSRQIIVGDVALLRAAAAEVFITDITQKAGVVAFTFDSRVDVPSLMAVCTMPGYRSRLRLSAGEPPRLQLHLSPGEDALAAAGGNRVKAAALLDISRTVLYEKMEQYQLK